jgi:ABC-type Fe3+ transport system permease subunit
MLGFAIFFGRRQVLALRQSTSLVEGERRSTRWQAARRLFGCLLLVILAILLGIAIFNLEVPAQQLADEHAASNRELTEDQRHFITVYSTTWLAILTLLVLVVLLAAGEVFYIRRQSVVARRRLLDEHKALLDQEATVRRLRHHG